MRSPLTFPLHTAHITRRTCAPGKASARTRSTLCTRDTFRFSYHGKHARLCSAIDRISSGTRDRRAVRTHRRVIATQRVLDRAQVTRTHAYAPTRRCDSDKICDCGASAARLESRARDNARTHGNLGSQRYTRRTYEVGRLLCAHT